MPAGRGCCEERSRRFVTFQLHEAFADTGRQSGDIDVVTQIQAGNGFEIGGPAHALSREGVEKMLESALGR